MNIAQQVDWGRDHVQLRPRNHPFRLVPVLQDVHLRRRRCHAFLQHALPDECVDERALPGIEFAHDDQQEQFVELLD